MWLKDSPFFAEFKNYRFIKRIRSSAKKVKVKMVVVRPKVLMEKSARTMLDPNRIRMKKLRVITLAPTRGD